MEHEAMAKLAQSAQAALGLRTMLVDGQTLQPPAGLPLTLQLLFNYEDCGERLIQESAEQHRVAIISNSLQLIWACLPLGAAAGNQLLVMGPVTYSHLGSEYLNSYLDQYGVSPALQGEVLKLYCSTPVVTLAELLRHLNFALHLTTGALLEESKILYLPHQKNTDSFQKWMGFRRWMSDDYQGTYQSEKAMCSALRRGDREAFSLAQLARQYGTMCPWDPLRQKKDVAIVSITVLTRAIIEGGVNSELALSLSDYYIQQAELAQTVSEVDQVAQRHVEECWEKIESAKVPRSFSRPINECRRHVAEHIREKLRAEDIAGMLGYNTYYLTYLFKKEVGITLSEYIRGEKVKVAKELLRESPYSLLEISELLSFSTPSYFAKIFKAVEGVTPKQYRLKHSEQ